MGAVVGSINTTLRVKRPLKDLWQGNDKIRCVFFCRLLKVYPGCNMEKRLKGWWGTERLESSSRGGHWWCWNIRGNWDSICKSPGTVLSLQAWLIL